MSTTLLYPYTTLEDVKFYCGIALTKTEWDENIKKAINKASRFIDSLTGRYFYNKTYTSEYLNGTVNFQGWQVLDQYIFTPQRAPIISVTTLIENETTLTENTDFYIDLVNGMIERASGCWVSRAREIQITCSLGYATDDTATPSADLPGEIAMHALELASRFSGRYKKEIKNFVSGGTESVDLYGAPKDIIKSLRALYPPNV